MLGDATQNVCNTISNASPLSSSEFKNMNASIIKNRFLSINLVTSTNFGGKKKTHCLSAREPTIVPNNMEDPKPAMKS